ncbi:hypothetical protein FQA47_019095 [Oryzias melastigma]|uniref:Secreted protein n=1 Tax=Oryzias melastigma TaxID=30732 RepID=A0A834BM71_ORYME|nr:hypothetical protein FQA47_019095 [Oryzias melastigma]
MCEVCPLSISSLYMLVFFDAASAHAHVSRGGRDEHRAVRSSARGWRDCEATAGRQRTPRRGRGADRSHRSIRIQPLTLELQGG